MADLPIFTVLPDLKAALSCHNHLVLVAPPGAGKTTQIPLALLNEPWLEGHRIIMLEPRRIAARAAARYMANLLKESVGETVGYRVRFDTKVGAKTRIEIITEGVLTRMLQEDPALSGVGLIIFDEFHERSVHADLGLALCLQSQEILREDLKILVMSATLDVEPISVLLGHAPIVISEGRAYPVETIYENSRQQEKLEVAVTKKIVTALKSYSGNILVFLPGVGEIRRVERLLAQVDLGDQIMVVPLHGSLRHEEQDLALKPCHPGWRKIVLATSIAETSLTVDGVRIVIDSGLMRVPRFSPRTGMTRLETVPITLAAAEQRRGRAGRIEPGICLRMWTEIEESGFIPNTMPEVYEADLIPLALELAVWGVYDPTELKWLDCPPAAALSQANGLLRQLGACDDSRRITEHGREMASLGCHPRLAHMITKAIHLNLGQLACEIASLLSERDIFRGFSRSLDTDLCSRIEVIRSLRCGKQISLHNSKDSEQIDLAACRRILTEVTTWEKSLRLSLLDGEGVDPDACGLLTALAYPDRIAQHRGGGRYLLQNGRGAKYQHEQSFSYEPYIVAIDLDDSGIESRIFLAAPIQLKTLLEHCGEQLQQDIRISWVREQLAVKAKTIWRLGSIVIKEEMITNPPAQAVLDALLQGIAVEGLQLLPWTKSARQLLDRLNFMNHVDHTWPNVNEQVLLESLAVWLGPYLFGITDSTDLKRLNLVSIFESMLSWEQRQQFEQLAPTHIQVPSGQRIPLDYSDPAKPVLAVRLQEMFGLTDTPRVANGKVVVTLHLLSPAYRPVQVTADLASFWQHAYYEVKRDLQGRYPKHYWPDDPLMAAPTHRAKPRK
jgi:ATP-dependent helicase HrpB